eukprot:CAMPEP_0197847124 /NCGR_PEP_ID=MMETSP1438-20131217/5232_1 /TAXON_ID=1461541 /ORGANISM="Pterosperma sp., Strain CCMP1384" /LENGTH=176 /DNA_ID=CAMNT_0043458955 /DNA_START=135 /DNA_END=665 /DNA_ORIENTATION=+
MDSVDAEELNQSLTKSRFLDQTVVTAGGAKAHPYLPMGRDIPGPNTAARHGPRTDVERKSTEPAWKSSGSIGERVATRCISPPKAMMRVHPTFEAPTSHKEWDNHGFNGVASAEKYAKYISSGQHKAHYVDQPISYKIKKQRKEGVSEGKGGNLGGYARAHVGMDTKSSLTFGRRG